MRRWAVGILAVVVGAFGVVLGVDRGFFSSGAQLPWPPAPCVVGGVDARCGRLVVPENRARPNGHTIGLHVVVLPAGVKPARQDAVAYLAGGPGDAATVQGLEQGWNSSGLRTSRDFLLVDQRGTGQSTRSGADPTQYGTRMAMDDLEAVRSALGYRQLDVIGSSYGATAAQVYARLHPSSVRALVLTGGTAIDIPYYGRYAANAQRALDQLAELCVADVGCRKTFPGWERRFGHLVKAWNVEPVHGMTGDDLASVVHNMLRDLNAAVSIPLVVSSAAKGEFAPLDAAGGGDFTPGLGSMASIWCNEPWVGLEAAGPWGTEFDSLATGQIAELRRECASVPRRSEPRSLWRLPASSSIPVLALVGGADPQDPIGNLSGLRGHFPDSRAVVFPHIGHDFGLGGCADQMIVEFVDRATTRGLDATRCDGAVVVPSFALAFS